MNKTICDLCKNEIKKDEKIFYFKIMDTSRENYAVMKEICQGCTDEILLALEVMKNAD